MREILTDNIKDGDIAATDIRSPSGNVLLNKGAAISAAMGRRLRNWGIMSVQVEGEDDSVTNVVTKGVSPAMIKEELYAKFHGTLDSARMKRIFDVVYEHKLRRNGAA